MQAFDPRPTPPAEIAQAARDGELVVFVGAGVSRLIGCPSWDGFADGALKQLVPALLSHYELAQIKTVSDAKKRLSLAKIVACKAGVELDYKTLLQATVANDSVYGHLAKFRCAFVTTNYDKHLVPEANATRDEAQWRFAKRDQLLGTNVDRLGNVVHLHGSVDDPTRMILSTREYLEHYASDEVRDFLTDLFRRKTVLFVGYGLEEVELLEYILRKGSAKREVHSRRYIIQGFFDAEFRLYQLLAEYYRDGFGSTVIPFSRDQADYHQLSAVLGDWASALQFGSLALADEIAALEEEIRG